MPALFQGPKEGKNVSDNIRALVRQAADPETPEKLSCIRILLTSSWKLITNLLIGFLRQDLIQEQASERNQLLGLLTSQLLFFHTL